MSLFLIHDIKSTYKDNVFIAIPINYCGQMPHIVI